VQPLTLPIKVLWVNGLMDRHWILGAGVGRSEDSIGLLSLQRRRDIRQIPRGVNVAVLVPSSLDRLADRSAAGESIGIGQRGNETCQRRAGGAEPEYRGL
jgi:hypothetical protein